MHTCACNTLKSEDENLLIDDETSIVSSIGIVCETAAIAVTWTIPNMIKKDKKVAASTGTAPGEI